MGRVFFLVCSAVLCLLIGAFSPFTSKVIIDRYVLITIFKNKFIRLFLLVMGPHCCTQGFSSGGMQGLLFIACAGFSLWWLLLLRSMGSRHVGFSSRGMQAQ